MSYVPSIQLSNHIRKILKCAQIPNINFIYAVSLWTDSQSAIAVSKHPVNHQRAKHIHMKYAYVQEEVARGAVKMEYIKSATNCADICTKSTGPKIHESHFPTIMGRTKIPRIQHDVIEKEDDHLLCPMCSSVLNKNK
jgi:hypothetical protein